MKSFFVLIILLAVLIFAGFYAYNHKNTVITDDTAIFIQPAIEPIDSPPALREKAKNATVGLGKKIIFNDIVIEPSSVIEESRCPKDVQCIQAGRVVVAITIHSLEGEHIVTSEIEEGASFSVGDTNITLVKVEPYPDTKVKAIYDEYQFTFLVEVIE